MQYLAIVQINDGKVHLPGSKIEISDKAEAKRLLAMGAIENINKDESTDEDEAIEDLMQISLVTREIATGLVANSVTSIAVLQKLSVEQIMAFKIKNVGKNTAEKILAEAINDFDTQED